MSTVKKRISEITQPKLGYIPVKSFRVEKMEDSFELAEENISASNVGTVVDYMSRFLTGTVKEKAFEISLMGARNINQLNNAFLLLHKINGNDVESIRSACKLVGYDVCYRAGRAYYKDVNLIEPDQKTITNIRIMLIRSIEFFQKYGPKVMDGISFEGAYTDKIQRADADFLTEDTLWDFKVIKGNITSKHTLQLMIYYIMGLHSVHVDKFIKIKKIGIFNPRNNTVYLKEISEIEGNVVDEISKYVIGYGGEIAERVEKPAENSVYTITDLMGIMECSRHEIMNYYAQYDLPLTKKGGRYYISQKEFEEWIEYMSYLEKKRKKKRMIAIMLYLIIVSLIVFWFISKFPIISELYGAYF